MRTQYVGAAFRRPEAGSRLRAVCCSTRADNRCIYTYMGTPTINLAECAGCACFAVRRAARAITQHYDRCLRPSGLRATQFTLLVMLSLEGELPLSQVAQRLGMERTTLTRNLRSLVAKRLVAVEFGDDRRVRMIAITPKGNAAVAAALPYWRKAQLAVAEYLPHQALRSLAAATEAARTS
jgi:DNA-binding MarR family transcriptional regulator